jgi:hypothetical protein
VEKRSLCADGVNDLDELASDVTDGGGVMFLFYFAMAIIDRGKEGMMHLHHAGGLEQSGAQHGAAAFAYFRPSFPKTTFAHPRFEAGMSEDAVGATWTGEAADVADLGEDHRRGHATDARDRLDGMIEHIKVTRNFHVKVLDLLLKKLDLCDDQADAAGQSLVVVLNAEALREFMGCDAVADLAKIPSWRGNLLFDREKTACGADRRRS